MLRAHSLYGVMGRMKTPLHDYLKPKAQGERDAFAARCGTTGGHLRNVALGWKPCSAALAVAIERESKGAIRCEEMCAEVDWPVVRGKRAKRREAA